MGHIPMTSTRITSFMGSLAMLVLLFGCGNRRAPACDHEAVAQLAQQLRNATPRDHPDLVMEQWACRGPAFVTESFEMRQRLRDGQSLAIRMHETMEARSRAFEKLCPEMTSIYSRAATKPFNQRAQVVYDDCDLARLNVISRERFIRRDTASTVPWAAYQWLLDDGVAADDARELTRALLLFKQREDVELSLPTDYQPVQAKIELPRVPLGTEIVVTPEQLYVDNRRFELPKSGQESLLPYVYEQLTKVNSQASAGPEKPVLNIYFDRRVKVSVATSILFTASKAGFDRWNFVVEIWPFDYGVVDVHVPEWTRESIRIRIEADGSAIRSGTESPELVHIDAHDDVTMAQWIEVATAERVRCTTHKSCLPIAFAR